MCPFGQLAVCSGPHPCGVGGIQRMLLGARTADVIGYGAPPLIPSRNKTIGDAEAADIHVKVWRSH